MAIALNGTSALGLALLPLSALFLWLLLRGGRVIWCLLVVGEGLTVIGVAWGKSMWWAAVAVVGLALLLAPASRRYVWKEAPMRRSLMAANEGTYSWGARIRSGALWEEMWTWIGDNAVNWGFIGRLAVVALVADVVAGAGMKVRATTVS